jgi:sugar phosphate permease
VEESRAFHWAWMILGICFMNLFVNYSVRLGYGVIMPEMIRTQGFGRAAAATIINSFFFVYISIAPFAGYLTDRIGAKRVIVISMLILSIGVVLMGTVQSLWMACIFFALTGLGAAGLWAPVLTLAQRWFAPHRRGFALGIISTGYGLGFATMGAVFPWIVERFNWRYAWFFLGSGALIMVLVNGLFLRSTPESSGLRPWGQKDTSRGQNTGIQTSEERLPLTALFHNSRFWLIGFSYLSISYSLYGITTFMVDYAKYQLELPLEKASLLAAIHGICQIVGVLTILPLSDHLGRKRTIIVGNMLITATLAGIVVAGTSWMALCILIGCMAIFYGATFPMYGACAGDYFPKEIMGTVIGAWTPLYGCGAILTHWSTGMLRDLTGIYNYAFIVYVVMGVLSIASFSLVKKNQRPPAELGV